VDVDSIVRRAFLSLLLIGGVAAAAFGHRAGPRTYAIDAGRSRATIAVGKSGLFSFAAGHPHEVVAPSISGQLTVDPADVAHATVHMTIDASALKVTGKGESPEDVPKVQATMASDQVLDVQCFPTIEFQGISISVKKPGTSTVDVIVSGRLTLHNQAGRSASP
jgi:polyisoprenoid-binding protein YceI